MYRTEPTIGGDIVTVWIASTGTQRYTSESATWVPQGSWILEQAGDEPNIRAETLRGTTRHGTS